MAITVLYSKPADLCVRLFDMYFIYVIRPVRAGFLEAMLPEEEEIMLKHFHYLQELNKAGTIVHVGRCADKSFGLVIFKAVDEAEAQSITNADPAVMAGIVDAELREFIPVFHSGAL